MTGFACRCPRRRTFRFCHVQATTVRKQLGKTRSVSSSGFAFGSAARGWLRHGNPPGDPSTAPRCGARTRAGAPCRAPRVRGRRRGRMHGGARGSGAPPGNQNALKHGEHGRLAVLERKAARSLMVALGP
ncbi:MAG: HGGxSTG domain-containing protein [Mycobacterium sp.]